jgi:hypothetical protein
VAIDHLVGQAQRDAQLADFVLEQLAQRLEQLEVEGFGQAADVVVALDGVGLAGLGAGRLDHVRVDGALGQPLGAGQLGGFGLEDLDELAADDLALGLGSETPFRWPMNCSVASTWMTLTPRLRANICITISPSLRRRGRCRRTRR